MSDQLQEAISQKLAVFTQEIVNLYRRAMLDAVSQVAGFGAAPLKRGPGRPKGAGRPAAAIERSEGGRKRRSSAQIANTADRIAKYIAANPGERAEDIKKALKIAGNQWALPVAKLISDKKIKTTGEKRATKYFPGRA